MITARDPAAMTAGEIKAELAELLARGYVRALAERIRAKELDDLPIGEPSSSRAKKASA